MLRSLSLFLLLAAAVGNPATAGPSPATEDAGATALEYQAHVAGVPVGSATVAVSLVDGTYQVTGEAESNGWLRGFTDWRNRFSARGRLEGAVRHPGEFRYSERDSRKSRQVLVRDGVVAVTKNGTERPTQPAPAGQDLVSALFVLPHCQGHQVLHTGRHVYRLSRLERSADGCRYAVVDDDDDRFEVDLVLVRRDGLVVPKRITAYGWLTASMELVEPEPS